MVVDKIGYFDMKKNSQSTSLIIALKVLFVASFTVMATSTVLLNGPSRLIEGLSLVFEGTSTCFSRVGQSHTAKLLKLSPNYLTNSFVSNTENCFGEILSLIRSKKLEKNLKGLYSGLNSLASDVHWFHQKLEDSSSFVKNKDSLGEKFSKLEVGRDQIFQQIIELQTKYRTKREKSYLIMTISSIMSLIILFVFGLITLIRAKSIRDCNDKLVKALKEGDFVSSDTAEDLIGRSLAFTALPKAGELFKKYLDYIREGKIPLSANVVRKPSKIRSASVDQGLPLFSKNWKAPSEVVLKSLKGMKISDIDSEDQRVYLEQVLLEVLDELSSKIFIKGILFNLDIDDNIKLNAPRSELSKFFRGIINYYINLDFKKEKCITIRLKKTSDSYDFKDSSDQRVSLFEIIDSEVTFSMKSLLDSKLPKELEIHDSLFKILNWKVATNNLISSNGKEVGSKLAFEVYNIFNMPVNDSKKAGTSRRLIGLKKGKKKFLQGQLSN